ncbi:uncharacterized protein AMSG_04186 [Thecamonas trahens ATCC 50062]|uniref:PH domain-containing protein n=1 Tax=Thecamonas trahens ATCC 50062 TaxID=461836 RepID=A0A0L0D6E1_THETB|nr:hypothetical protein AMSG_04186 [Thecamonas trahens ATCC 50062]KNC47952.1 hypothetical protein AMSG_04186 [Thecamonas trahens ATCC 50062]|eukprot:XP_013758969.1 hypothetical protein AMSG_04186 [Thecamonas trahens ATCC 50062]
MAFPSTPSLPALLAHQHIDGVALLALNYSRIRALLPLTMRSAFALAVSDLAASDTTSADLPDAWPDPDAEPSPTPPPAPPPAPSPSPSPAAAPQLTQESSSPVAIKSDPAAPQKQPRKQPRKQPLRPLRRKARDDKSCTPQGQPRPADAQRMMGAMELKSSARPKAGFVPLWFVLSQCVLEVYDSPKNKTPQHYLMVADASIKATKRGFRLISPSGGKHLFRTDARDAWMAAIAAQQRHFATTKAAVTSTVVLGKQSAPDPSSAL